jgi:hypothetical protein
MDPILKYAGGFEDVIPVLVILAVIISQIVKAGKAVSRSKPGQRPRQVAPPPRPAATPSRPQAPPLDPEDEMRRFLESLGAPTPRPASARPPPPPPPPVPAARPLVAETRKPDTQPRRTPRTATPKRFPLKPAPRRAEPVRLRPEPFPLSPAYRTAETRKRIRQETQVSFRRPDASQRVRKLRGALATRGGLTHGILMREILGPPIGLRRRTPLTPPGA